MMTGIALMCCMATHAVYAQAREEVTPLKIRKITGESAKTPEYRVIGGVAQGKTRNWYRVTAYYDTLPEWMDELKVRYYILLKDKKNSSKMVLFNGVIDYVNVAQGRQHKTEAYLHPSTMDRYGDVEAVAVEFIYQGKPVARESRPETNQRWWENYTPVSGYVLNRMQSPFAMINFDDYEAIKAPVAGR
ncbi:MAG: hypothetical protein EOM20_12275 [Spartobacteria bacterium]|nr:hypothetical protein [Spartobacteria bacterium]